MRPVIVKWPGSEKEYTFRSAEAAAKKLEVSLPQIYGAAGWARPLQSGTLRGFTIAWGAPATRAKDLRRAWKGQKELQRGFLAALERND